MELSEAIVRKNNGEYIERLVSLQEVTSDDSFILHPLLHQWKTLAALTEEPTELPVIFLPEEQEVSAPDVKYIRDRGIKIPPCIKGYMKVAPNGDWEISSNKLNLPRMSIAGGCLALLHLPVSIDLVFQIERKKLLEYHKRYTPPPKENEFSKDLREIDSYILFKWDEMVKRWDAEPLPGNMKEELRPIAYAYMKASAEGNLMGIQGWYDQFEEYEEKYSTPEWKEEAYKCKAQVFGELWEYWEEEFTPFLHFMVLFAKAKCDEIYQSQEHKNISSFKELEEFERHMEKIKEARIEKIFEEACSQAIEEEDTKEDEEDIEMSYEEYRKRVEEESKEMHSLILLCAEAFNFTLPKVKKGEAPPQFEFKDKSFENFILNLISSFYIEEP
ncbi:MAG: hypothetical protein Q4E67_01420 [Planctomycetia bacterium]|nr:hypothetical protein [Planctomycetia bacterium]